MTTKATSTAPRDLLAARLGELAGPDAFSARRSAPVGELAIEVRGVGTLALPVPSSEARKLCAIARPARFGKGAETVLDKRVRDTWEIPLSRVKIDKRRWDKSLLPVLARLGTDLGLPPGCELVAELHSMLVYAPGQFFLPHQDSEKVDGMVGSLVVMLPSTSTGGSLEVLHRGERAVYRPSKTSLSLIAFYADCRHQVKPVKSGYRAVLTYNLVLRGGAQVVELNSRVAAELAGHLDRHFDSPAGRPARDTTDNFPRRLVYLLDHEYTERALGWSRLKGVDARRATALRAAAERAGCEAGLALADVHESWSCYEPEWDRPLYGRRGYTRWDGEDDVDEEFDEDDWDGGAGGTDAGSYSLEELVAWSTTLEYWTDPAGGSSERISLSVRDGEVCATTRSVDLEPYNSEYEGYMGNWGNTMDRWYHRGAVVVWPREQAFAVHAEVSPAWALETLSKTLRTGEVATARKMAATLVPFWKSVVGADTRKSYFSKALRVACAIGEPEIASMVLGPFPLEVMSPSHAPAFAAMVDHYGEEWTRRLLDIWTKRDRRWRPSGDQGRPAWIAALPALCEKFDLSAASGVAAARILLEHSWKWTLDAIAQGLDVAHPSEREEDLGELAEPIVGVLRAAALAGVTDVIADVVSHLCAHDDALTGCLLSVLRGSATLYPSEREATRLDAIADHVADRLRGRLAVPPRSEDDWSMRLPAGCTCELCSELDKFVGSRSRRSFEWPLAQDRRRHVHGRIDTAELPVTHMTRRRGSPYTLVLTKTVVLFEDERESRRRDEEDLAWLDAGWKAKSGGSRRAGKTTKAGSSSDRAPARATKPARAGRPRAPRASAPRGRPGRR